MAKTIKVATITRLERIIAASKVPCGTYPGANRARVFKDRKKEANRRCRREARRALGRGVDAVIKPDVDSRDVS